MPDKRRSASRPTRSAKAADTVPRLASDVLRSYIVAAAGLFVFLGAPFLLVLVTDDVSPSAIIAASTLIGWSFLALASALFNWIVFRAATGEELERWLSATTPTTMWRRVIWSFQGGGAISWAISGSGIAVAAVVILSQREEYRTSPLVIVSAIAAVASSVLMIISAYAVRYGRTNSISGGIEFASTPHPRFVDYFYLAAQVSTTFSTSDVTVTSASMRRAVAAHSLIAFTFNTVIVALLVSLLISSVN